jgi:hypothetical protein
MPISIRKLGPTFTAANYWFLPYRNYSAVEDWPWLRTPDVNTQLCSICAQLNFRWLFKESLAGSIVTDGASTSQLSDGICLGLYADASRRLDCQFCQLLIYSFEEGADIDMLNDRDDWPKQEIWLRNHSVSGSGKVVDFESQKDEHVVRLDVRLKANDEEGVMFSSGGRTVTIQVIQEDPSTFLVQLFEGRAVDQSTTNLVHTIQRWIAPCLNDCRSAISDSQRHDSANIRLVDTTNACIVGPKRDEKYVVLRYPETLSKLYYTY